MTYLALALYLISSIMRPADWWGPLFERSVDDWIFLTLFAAAVVNGQVARIFDAARSQIGLLMLGYVLFSVVTLLANGATDSISDQLQYNFKLYCIFLAFAAASGGPLGIRTLLLVVVILAAIIAYQGFTMLETGVGLAGQGLYWGGRIRWIGMYNGANVLCMLFVIAMSFVIHFLFGPWGLLSRLVAAAAGALILGGIYLTNSRGGYLAFLIVVGLYILLRGQETLKRIGPKRLVAAAGLLLVLSMVGPSRMESMNDSDHSAAGRIDAWQEGLEMVRESPLFGIGSGEWLLHHHKFAHNSLVHTAGETGLLGLFLWIAMLYAGTKLIFGLYATSEDARERSVVASLLAAIGGFLAASFFITTIQFDLTYIFFGMAWSLAGNQSAEWRLTGRDLKRIAIIEVVGLVAVYVTVRVFYGSG